MSATYPSTAHGTALLQGEPLWIGNIVSAAAGTKVDNATTASPFTLAGGEKLLLQAATAFYVEVIAAASMTASGGKAILVAANEMVSIGLRASSVKVCIDPVAGAATVRVFKMVA